jgi:hypothetical protein
LNLIKNVDFLDVNKKKLDMRKENQKFQKENISQKL